MPGPESHTPWPAISLHTLHTLPPCPASDLNVLASKMCALEPRLYKRAREAPYRVNIGTPWAGPGTALQHRTEDARPPGICSLGQVVNGARPTGSCRSRTQKASAAGGAGRCSEYVGGAQSSNAARESPEGGNGSLFPL